MKKWMYVAIAVVVVVGVALAVYFVQSDVPSVETATSMLFSVEVTNNETAVYTYMAEDIGTHHLKLRVEWWGEGFKHGVILNGELGQASYLENDNWVELPQKEWDAVWHAFVTEFEMHRSELYEWREGDWTYTDPDFGYLFRIYDIEVDPELDDALFAALAL